MTPQPSQQQNQQISVWLFHDNPVWPKDFAMMLRGKGLKVLLTQRPSECLERVKLGMGSCDVLLIHKDLGQYYEDESGLGITSDVVVSQVHNEAPFVRVGVISGEYPDGDKHVLSMQADFYLPPTALTDEWALTQIQKGVVSPKELEKRGKLVERPPEPDTFYGFYDGYGKER